jgi:nickel-dependent lactate racemase
MTLFLAEGSATTQLSEDELRQGVASVLEQLGPRSRVIAVPPDYSRFHSRAGTLTCLAHEQLGDRLVDVLPALGTHHPMKDEQLERMFPSLPKSLIRIHRWRDDVVTLGKVPAEFVRDATSGIWDQPWPAQMNKLIAQGGHDLILSIGQVVPHEVIGMANYNKNLFIGTGGAAGINESHFISAAYGIERILGRADNPVRRILNEAERLYCRDLPIVYLLTVVGANSKGDLVVRGLFAGDDLECFERASELALEVNFTYVDEPVERMVVYLDPEEFESTWLGNKSIYRTRMAIADGGELIVIAPGVSTFGEDEEIDRLIRKYGYRTTPEVMQLVKQNTELQANLSAAAHLIHSSSEGRFRITYCPGAMTREEVEGVGYAYGDLAETTRRYRPDVLKDGWNTLADGERIYFVSRPAHGLWAHRSRLHN